MIFVVFLCSLKLSSTGEMKFDALINWCFRWVTRTNSNHDENIKTKQKIKSQTLIYTNSLTPITKNWNKQFSGFVNSIHLFTIDLHVKI